MTKSKNEAVFLTGGTGFLGSHIGTEFLRRGQEVWFLVRPEKRKSAEKRLSEILDWHGVESTFRHNASVVEGTLESCCRRFIHISTAYAAGRISGPCKEEPVINSHFFNIYEESKAAAKIIPKDHEANQS
jgi:nucleoside-diphosphate-sugar epimerase